MSGETQSVMSCSQFEALLSDGLDNQLGGAETERFDAHRQSCAACRTMYAEAESGMMWLRSLEEVEPPAALVHNIMMATAGAPPLEAAPASHPREGWWSTLRSLGAHLSAPVLQPRLVMSFGMVFFSLSVLLNVVGFNLRDLRYLDLRPSAIVRGYYEATGRLAKYYENIRLVYEIESRVQQLKRVATPEQTTPPSSDKNDKDKGKGPADRSGLPDRKFQNYSREEGQPVLAVVPRGHSDHESASTVRRLS